MKLNLSQILKGVGEVVGVFNPAIGGGLVLVGNLADEFDGISDEVLENNFVGLGKSAEIIRSIANKGGELSSDDIVRLNAIAENLDGMNLLLSKIQKIFK